jgi:hypothetical protein|tara:strand:+ start:1240 stop:1455 length:216 start_codon:yes stop_codon:yes gene_type:complete
MIFGMDIDFNTDHADSIIEHCQNRGMNEMESWLHLLAAAVSLCPKKEMSQAAIEMIHGSEADCKLKKEELT